MPNDWRIQKLEIPLMVVESMLKRTLQTTEQMTRGPIENMGAVTLGLVIEKQDTTGNGDTRNELR